MFMDLSFYFQVSLGAIINLIPLTHLSELYRNILAIQENLDSPVL